MSDMAIRFSPENLTREESSYLKDRLKNFCAKTS